MEQDGFILDATESRVTSANKEFAKNMAKPLKSKNGPETRHVNMANTASAEKAGYWLIISVSNHIKGPSEIQTAF